MAFNTETFSRAAFKRILRLAHTKEISDEGGVAKDPVNESIASNIIITASIS